MEKVELSPEDVEQTARKVLGYCGRMISASKSGYREVYPDNLVVFNANVVAEGAVKIWYGDLDVTLDTTKLQSLATLTRRKIYVLSEMDGRFVNESTPRLENARATFNPEV